ncbi:hypothetical protein OH77DRAFT_1429107 [Trametes cingulata]|nr:hypothetical protein OH77DRAFT_1429107 [Trametes cingulata]
MSHRHRSSPPSSGRDDAVTPTKRSRMELEDDAMDTPRGGGSGVDDHYYGRGSDDRDRDRRRERSYSTSRSPSRERGRGRSPRREHSRRRYYSPQQTGRHPTRFAPGPAYPPAHAYPAVAAPYPSDTGPFGGFAQTAQPGPWERVAHAYQELADVRAKHATEMLALRDKHEGLLTNLADARVKENELRQRIRDRDRKIKDLENALEAAHADLTASRTEADRMRAELTRRDQARRRPPFQSDHGWNRGPAQHPVGPATPTAPAGNRVLATTGNNTNAVPAATPAVAAAPARHDEDIVMGEGAVEPPQAGVPAEAAATGGAPPRVPEDEDSDIDESLSPAEREKVRIQHLKYKRDPDLEASNQPRSAWYRNWISERSIAGQLAALDFDDEGNDELGVDSVLPDPIDVFGPKMTKAADSKEVSRAVKAGGKKAAGEFPSSNLPELGRWAGTTIKSVVQAHNLRWFATVEREEDAIRFYKWLNTQYCKPAFYRPPGIRYLMASMSDDGRVLSGDRTIPRSESTPRETLGRYPPPHADQGRVWRFFSAPTNTWPVGMRLASGRIPEGDGFGAPHEEDVQAYFLLWHLLPQRPAASPHRHHDARIHQLATELFSIAGWYDRIVRIGEYASAPTVAPRRYPYSSEDSSHLHIAAWFCTHGVGTEAPVIRALERWGVISRNHDLGRAPFDNAPWPSAPLTLESVSTPTATASIVKIDEIAWGDALPDAERRNLDDWDELIDVD